MSTLLLYHQLWGYDMGTSQQDSFYPWGWIRGSSFLCLSCCVVKENFERCALFSHLGWSREWYFTLVCIFSSAELGCALFFWVCIIFYYLQSLERFFPYMFRWHACSKTCCLSLPLSKMWRLNIVEVMGHFWGRLEHHFTMQLKRCVVEQMCMLLWNLKFSLL